MHSTLVLYFLLTISLLPQDSITTIKRINVGNNRNFTIDKKEVLDSFNTGINLSINNNIPKSEDSSSWNLVNLFLGLSGIFITIALGLGGKNYFSLRKFKVKTKKIIDELILYGNGAKTKFKDLETEHITAIDKFNLMQLELSKLIEVLQKNSELAKKEEYSSFYKESILSKLSDTQPKEIIESSLRQVAKMDFKEAVPYIDTLLSSPIIDGYTKSFANEIKKKLI